MEFKEIQKEILGWKTSINGELTTTWRSPSNIALLKYWGKREGQLPVNPSLSFSLSKAHNYYKINR